METAQVILQLAGHHELLQAELARIVEDMKSLVEVSKRYPHLKELFVTSHRDLGKLKKQKEEQEREIRNHLQCYELHRPSGEKILKKLAKGASVPQPPQSDLSLSSVSGPTAPLSTGSKRKDANASTQNAAAAAPSSSSLRGAGLHGGDLLLSSYSPLSMPSVVELELQPPPPQQQQQKQHTSDTSYFDRHVHRLGEAISPPQQQPSDARGSVGIRQWGDKETRHNTSGSSAQQHHHHAYHSEFGSHAAHGVGHYAGTAAAAVDLSHHGIHSSVADSSVM